MAAAEEEQSTEQETQPQATTDPEEVRSVDIYYDLGRAITALRLQQGYPPEKARSGRVQLDTLEAVEQALGCIVPDPIVAYVSSGLGSIRTPDEIIGLTEELLAHVDADDDAVRNAAQIAFDLADGDYLAFRRGAARDDESIVVFRHQESYDAEETTVMDWVTDQLDEKVAQTVQPFEALVEQTTEAERDEIWVTHTKFGRGMVVATESTTQGDKLTVRFTEDGEVRKLLERFITYD